MEDLNKYVKSMIDNELDKNKYWNSDSYFYFYKNLSIDQRGRIEEHLLRDIFIKNGYKVEYIDNDHGDWDI